MRHRYILIGLLTAITTSVIGQNQQGYDLWMGYRKIENEVRAAEYRNITQSIFFQSGSDMLKVAQTELVMGLSKMLDSNTSIKQDDGLKSTLIIGKESVLSQQIKSVLGEDNLDIKDEGFLIRSIEIEGQKQVVITAKDDRGILYGTFRFLQTLQKNKSLLNLSILDAPKINLRMLNHWDNLDRTVERGYAGLSLWNWQKLPEFIDQRYIDYARANASIGINGSALTNVNANALVLTPLYLEKVAALADVFRPYGIKVFLTARFSAPIQIGGLSTADPLSSEVINWWKKKTEEIYEYIPDFGGFLVKANSEGQPGPQNYGRTHADGANMLGEMLKPFNGVVIWRAFVYSEHDPTDRAKQAYSEFVPFDGQFGQNVMIQSKNGPIDFQPREPFHPLFGAMPKTPLMMEFQITQEYLGFSTHLAFLPTLFEEVLQSDTYVKGEGSTVAKVIDGSLHGNSITGMAGVSNIGNDINWTGHPFGQANWYGFGRLAWNPDLDSEEIAKSWLSLTYSTDPQFSKLVTPIMLGSREAIVNYMNPLGLHHLFNTGHHYGPGPWVNNLSRPEWNPTYYHKADGKGIGFNRTVTGSNATAQYANKYSQLMNNPATCPEKYLLWYHHLPWDYKLASGEKLWDGLALQYQKGVDQVREMISTWEKTQKWVSPSQHNEVKMLMQIQLKEAIWWKDASLSYFQQFSKMAFPEGVEKPLNSLEYYQAIEHPFAPGIRPSWD